MCGDVRSYYMKYTKGPGKLGNIVEETLVPANVLHVSQCGALMFYMANTHTREIMSKLSGKRLAETILKMADLQIC